MFTPVSVTLLAVLLALAPPPAETTGPGVAPVSAGAEVIAGHYVVTLRPTTTQPRDTAASLTARHGGTVRHVYRHALQGFSARMTPAEAAKVAADSRVALVEHDIVVRADATQPNAPWNLDRADQRALPLSTTYTYPSTAAGVHVYVIDSGLRLSHQDFGGRASGAYDFLDDDPDVSDCNGHGTHVAGTVGGTTYGAAKGVTIHALRVLDCDGNGSGSVTTAAIDWVTANAIRPAVVNMSLSSAADTTKDNAVRASIAAGIHYVLAGGNYSSSACDRSPARVAEAITVGNTTRTDTRNSTSNYGSCLDLFAPGTDVVSASHDTDTDTRTLSGTSMAAPLVAGAVALYLAANPTATPAQASAAMIECSTKNVVISAGTGSPNRLLFLPCGGGPLQNDTDLPVPDWSTAHSQIAVSQGGNAPAALAVAVRITHPYRGDIALDLIAPDGTVYPLKEARVSDLADNIDATYTVDASSEPASGTWQLRVRDTFGFDTGVLDRWSMAL